MNTREKANRILLALGAPFTDNIDKTSWTKLVDKIEKELLSQRGMPCPDCGIVTVYYEDFCDDCKPMYAKKEIEEKKFTLLPKKEGKQ